MEVIIIEDELPARARLVQMLAKLRPDINIVAQLGSVKDSLDWLRTNPTPDIAFVDIQLSDDHSFEIFRRFEVTFPVIFLTAYDKFLMESLEFNSIDYLLKPVSEEKLSRALQKVRKLEHHFLKGVKNLVTPLKSRTQRIVARKGSEFVVLEPSEIAYFYTEHKIVFARDTTGRVLIVDGTLSDLEQLLDKEVFFRVNRKYIVHITAIQSFKPDNGKVLVNLKPTVSEAVHVSKETAPLFRQWIMGVEKA